MRPGNLAAGSRLAAWNIALALGVGTCVLPGCVRPVLTLEDGVTVRSARPVELTAHVEREIFGLLRTSVSDAPVQFYAGDVHLGSARTDRRGKASLEIDARALGDSEFSAQASVWNATLNETGRVFELKQERVALIVDVDHTIARTDYRALVFGPMDGGSEPIADSQAVLTELAEEFAIVYVTGRPRLVQEKTRAWLAAHGYPPGPVVVASELRAAARNGTFKMRVLRELQTKWPNLLIGIGDRPTDARAYGANQMLTLIIAPREIEEIGPHALLMPDWKAVRAFFAANREALTDPQAVRDLVAGRAPLLLTVPPYNGDDEEG